MNVAELERLLEQVTQGNWSVDGSYVTSDAMHEMDCVAESHRYDGEYDLQLMALAPSLARRVIAAEKLVEALHTARDYVSDSHIGALLYDDGKPVSETMTTEDLAMIDASLTAYGATK